MRASLQVFLGLSAITLLGGSLLAGGCSASAGGGGGFGGDSTGSKGTSSHHSGSGAGNGTGGNILVGVGGSTGSSTGTGMDPTTCAQAQQFKTYIGCDFWPTVTANSVWSEFDFAAVVANAGDSPAVVTVEQNGTQIGMPTTVAPNSLATIYLPWVAELKGLDADTCGNVMVFSASVMATGGAYHLTSTVPVTVYQFNALEYKGAGGPPGKAWSQCPGLQYCKPAANPLTWYKNGCFSFSNDASLLLPSTAMTGNYRVTGHEGWIAPVQNPNPPFNIIHQPVLGPTLAITGTADGTTVNIKLSALGHVLVGGPFADTPGGNTLTFMLNAGDVAELVGDPSTDFSGSLVQADKPVQVITGMPGIDIPVNSQAADHIEESVLPAETLGKDYFVTVPTGPNFVPVGHVVKLYGNVDGTNLTYPAGNPAGGPATIGAGDMVDLGVVSQDFEIKGDHEFAVASFQLGGTVVDKQHKQNQKGDPSQSAAVAVEQYRTKYIFLAPQDYEVSFVDVVQPMTAVVTIDGVKAPAPKAALGSSGYGVARLSLAAGNNGAHVLTATEAVGIQVMGYGSYTSYQYPGGLNLSIIAPPPVN